MDRKSEYMSEKKSFPRHDYGGEVPVEMTGETHSGCFVRGTRSGTRREVS